MSSNWSRYRLEELGDIVTGKTPPSKVQDAFSYSGTQFVTPRDMDGRRWIDSTERFLSESGVAAVKNSLVPSGSVAVSCIGSDMGKAALLKVESVTNQQINTLVVDTQKFNPKFVYYILSTKQDEFKSIAGGSATPILNKGHFGKFEIDLPTKDEQDFLVRCLDFLDSKIENNTKTNQTLEQIAQAIFKSWFVDFGPVKAKIETLAAGGCADDAELAAMRVISAKTVDELNALKASNPETFNKLAQTAALFPVAMQDSELGEIPVGWSVEQLGDHLNVLQTGSRPKGGVGGITEGVPSVGAENILGVGKYTYGKEKFVSRVFFDKLKRGVVEDFDFLLYKDGGKPGEFKPRVSMFGCGFPYSEFAINEHVFRMRSESLGQAFLYFQIGHKRVLDELANRGGKAAIPGINQTDVKTIPVLVPGTVDLLTEFNEFAQKIIESILKKSNESNHLVSIRDALLPKLLNGEIDLTSEVVA